MTVTSLTSIDSPGACTTCGIRNRRTMFTQLSSALLALCSIFALSIASARSFAQDFLGSSVSAISFSTNGTPQVNSFATDVQGDLYMEGNDANPLFSYKTNLGNPGTMIGSPSVVTYLAGKTQCKYAFVTGANGHLYCCYTVGTWGWADLGTPGVALTGTPSALLYSDTGERIHCFVLGSNNRLYDYNWTGRSWVWSDRGNPGANLLSPMSVTTYVYNGQRKIYLFATSLTNRSASLYTCYFDQFGWHWANQGRPNPLGPPEIGAPSVVSWVDQAGEHLYAFVAAHDLYCNYWNGQWHWADQGSAGAGVVSPQAVAYNDGQGEKIFCFVNGGNDLYVNYWTNGWHWADQGWSEYNYPTSALTFNIGGVRQIFSYQAASVGLNDPDCNYWNGTGWHWFGY